MLLLKLLLMVKQILSKATVTSERGSVWKKTYIRASSMTPRTAVEDGSVRGSLFLFIIWIKLLRRFHSQQQFGVHLSPRQHR